MSAETILSTVIGIVVSVLLAVIGYRQTIGAQQERVRHANEQAVQSVLKLVFGDFHGDIRFVLNEIRSAIALEHRVPETQVWSERSLRRIAASRILNNDVLAQSEKVGTISRALLLDGSGNPTAHTEAFDEVAAARKSEEAYSRRAAVLWTTLGLGFAALASVLTGWFIQTVGPFESLPGSQEPVTIRDLLPLALIVALGGLPAVFLVMRELTSVRLYSTTLRLARKPNASSRAPDVSAH